MSLPRCPTITKASAHSRQLCVTSSRPALCLHDAAAQPGAHHSKNDVSAGPRTAKGISDAATAAIPSKLVTPIKSASQLTSFRASSGLVPQVLLATEKAAISPLFRAMSVRFKDRLKFAAVTGPTAAELQGELRLERLPGIVLLPARGDTVTYDGEPAGLLHMCTRYLLAAVLHAFCGACQIGAL